MSTNISAINEKASPHWEEILGTSFVFEENCWHDCGGYCCDIQHGNFSFKLLPSSGTSLLLLGPEYDWMVANGHNFPNGKPREILFDFGGPAPLRIMVTDCALKGACPGKFTRPLHCRLYPFLPVFDVHGALADIYPASIFDLTLLSHAGKTHCNVLNNKRDSYFKAWSTSFALNLLRHPLIMFYLAVYKIASDIYIQKFNDNEVLKTLEGASFWQRWELLYLGKKFFDAPETKVRALEIFKEYEQVYGNFL